MGKYGAVPPGYKTVGEVAKKMGVTVRTLQYYDRKQLLSPSAMSEGGRRLYTDRDVVKLHQILSLKSLGFSLDDIRERLIALDTPAKVADALAEQASRIQQELERLGDSLRALEQLREEVLQMQSVDFKKYADIIVNLQMKNESYPLIKRFDDTMLDDVRSRFDKKSGADFLEEFNRLNQEIARLEEDGVPPESEACQRCVAAYWRMVEAFTGGDARMIEKLTEIGEIRNAQTAWEKRQARINKYLEAALEVYFSRLGVNPLEGGTE